ncbi:MAG: acyltransferase [bacterium]|nr:acyltransferase [bacterium]
MSEIRGLTSLRAIAAFLVFMYHYAWLFPSNAHEGIPDFSVPFMRLWMSGQVGVSIFFVLSGFLITRLYYDRFSAGTGTLRLYFVKRIARIWPLFLVLAVVQHVVLWARGTPPSLDWLVTLTMTQGFFRDLRYSGLPTAWSLTIEESFYAVAPSLYVIIGAFALGRHADIRPWSTATTARFVLALSGAAAALFGCSAVLVYFVQAFGWKFGGFMGDITHVLHATLGGRFAEFGIGVACAFVHRRGRIFCHLDSVRASALAVASALGIALCMWIKGVGGEFVPAWPQYACSYAIAILTGVLILALSQEEARVSRLLSNGLLVYLGRISYGFYLIQLTVIMDPMLRFTDSLGPWRLPALCILMNLVCAGLYELVENPARRGIVARFGGAAVGQA